MFQVHAMQTMHMTRRDAMSGSRGSDVIFLEERSIYSSREIFTELAYRKGDIPEDSLYIIDHMFKDIISSDEIRGMIYLECDPKKVMDRIGQRGHAADMLITENYLTELEVAYKEWVKKVTWAVIIVNTGIEGAELRVREALEMLVNPVENNNTLAF